MTPLTAAARPLIAGNWKMNGLANALDQARAIAAAVEGRPPAARVALCPPATLIDRMREILAGSTILVGGQDCRAEVSGRFYWRHRGGDVGRRGRRVGHPRAF